MQSPAPPRSVFSLLVACAALVSAGAFAAAQPTPRASTQPASTLPSNQPTAQPPAQPIVPPATPPVSPRISAQQQPKHANVSFSHGALSVSADNASLNQILRQISTETGMRITGGVTDERVFGHYGPSAPSQVLAALLDGTGSNMLLLHRDGNIPAELVLTPRTGGVTPPNPNAAIFNEQPEPAPPAENFSTSEPDQPGQNEAQPIGTDSSGAPISSAPNETAPSEPDQPQSPNGVKTPQQIYDQLERLRQQNQQPPPQ